MKRIVIAICCLIALPGYASKPLLPLGEGNAQLQALADKAHAGKPLGASEQKRWNEFQQDAFNYDLLRDNIWPICGEVATDVAAACSSLNHENKNALYADGKPGRVKMYYRISAEDRKKAEGELDALVAKWSGK